MIKFSDDHIGIGEVTNTQMENMLPANFWGHSKANHTHHYASSFSTLFKETKHSNCCTDSLGIKIGKWEGDHKTIFMQSIVWNSLRSIALYSRISLTIHWIHMGKTGGHHPHRTLFFIWSLQTSQEFMQLNLMGRTHLWPGSVEFHQRLIYPSVVLRIQMSVYLHLEPGKIVRKGTGSVAAFYTAMWEPHIWFPG